MKYIKRFFCIKILFFLSSFLLVIQAQKNTEPELQKLTFRGNEIIPSEELFQVIKLKETPSGISQFLHNTLSSALGDPAFFFNKEDLKEDSLRVLNFYQSKGFFKTRLLTNFTISEDGKNAEVQITIVEGDRAKLDKAIKITGLGNIEPEFKKELEEKFFTVNNDEFYSEDYVNNILTNTSSFLKERGYIKSKVDDPNITVDTLKNRYMAKVSINFNPGKRYKIKDIIVSKTGPLHENIEEEVLKEIVDLQPGEYYNTYLLDQAQFRLFRTSLFSRANVEPASDDTSSNAITLKIDVETRKLWEISPELGVVYEENGVNDNKFKYGIGLGFSKSNFFGNARKFSISSSISSDKPHEAIEKLFSSSDEIIPGEINFRATIEQPFLFGKVINTKFETHYSYFQFLEGYYPKSYGLKVNLNFELPKFTFFTAFSLSLNWEHSDIHSTGKYNQTELIDIYQKKDFNNAIFYENFFNKIFENIESITLKNDGAFLNLNLTANRTNDPSLLFPTQGYLLSFLFEGGLSSSKLTDNVFYYKYLLSFSTYNQVFDSRRTILALKFKTGYIAALRGDKANIPFTTRFYSGGSNSLRGWSEMELFPPENEKLPGKFNSEYFTQIDPKILASDLTKGGFLLIESSAELRFPIFGQLRGAFFIDVGNSLNSFDDFRFNKLEVNWGLGLRYFTSFVPFRIDFAFPIYKSDKFFRICEIKFQFGIGESF